MACATEEKQGEQTGTKKPAKRWPVDGRSRTSFVKTAVEEHNSVSLTRFSRKGKTNLFQNGLRITRMTMITIKPVGISLRILKYVELLMLVSVTKRFTFTAINP